jgi:hypothetical protein
MSNESPVTGKELTDRANAEYLASRGRMAEMRAMAESIAKSGMFGIRTADQALVLMALSQAEGRHPVLAARDFHIIQGTPAKKAEAMLRDFLSAGGKVQWHELTDAAAEATFSHPQGGEVRIKWDAARVAQAGLGSNAMHKKFPRQMLRSRVVSEGVRTVWPGATSGMYVPEEASEMRDPIDVTPPTAPVDTAADLDAFAGGGWSTKKEAETAAAEGTEGFRAFWHDLSAADRDQIRGDLETYQAIAREADAARERDAVRVQQDEDPFGLPPLPEAPPPEPVTEAPAVPFAAAVRALVPIAGDDGEPNWQAWSEAFVALVQQATPAEARKCRLSDLPHYGKCRTEDGDAARAVLEAVNAKSKEAPPP